MAEIKDQENALILETTKGKVVIELYPDLAPGHVARGFGNVSRARSDIEHCRRTLSFCERRLQLRECRAQSAEHVIGPLYIFHRARHHLRRHGRIVEQLDAAPSPRSEEG